METSSGAALAERLGYRPFDADNHYFEPPDTFVRYLPTELVNATERVLTRAAENQSAVTPPGALFEFFNGNPKGTTIEEAFEEVGADQYPEFTDRTARLLRLDDQGLRGAWMFPSSALGLDTALQADVATVSPILHAFNEWLHDDWGFAYENRLFATPFLSLSDVDWAVRELDWCLERGARVITLRNGPVFVADGSRSPGDPVFDPFWARVQEADVVVTTHVSGDDGYGFASKMWANGGLEGPDLLRQVTGSRIVVPHFYGALVLHKVFERFPGLRFASVENGGDWVPDLLERLHRADFQNPGHFQMSPVDQFREHVWVSPFWDKVDRLAAVLPVERILFGSDWPHMEGLPEPLGFIDGLANFGVADVRKIMHDNIVELMGLPPSG